MRRDFLKPADSFYAEREAGRGDHGADYGVGKSKSYGHRIRRVDSASPIHGDHCWHNWRQGEPCSNKVVFFAWWNAPAIHDENSKLADFHGGERTLCAALCEEHGRQFAEMFGVELPAPAKKGVDG